MKYWIQRVVKPFVRDFGYQKLCEIGASYGGATDLICAAPNVTISVIDPCLDADLAEKYKHAGRVKVFSALSLEMLPKICDQFDCFLIDGDHNWYTVFNELKTIHSRRLLKEGGAIFLHDVGWPYGRRDTYYQPSTIPQPFLRKHAKAGIVYGQKVLSPSQGCNAEFCNAEQEGGSKNGVLTAVEDFMKEVQGSYQLFCFRDECGLGILVERNGIGSGLKLLKWRIMCLIANLASRPKVLLRHHLPGGHRLLRTIVPRAPKA